MHSIRTDGMKGGTSYGNALMMEEMPSTAESVAMAWGRERVCVHTLVTLDRLTERKGKGKRTSRHQRFLIPSNLVPLRIPPLRDLGRPQHFHEPVDERVDRTPLRTPDDPRQGRRGRFADFDLGVAQEVAQLVDELRDEVVVEEEEVVEVED